MAKDEVLFGYALLDDTQQTVSIDDIDRPYTRLHKFFCPHCHNEMYATFGEVQLPHFRHNGDKCQHSKYLHDLAEHVFYEEYSKCLDEGTPFYLDLRIPRPCNEACVLKKHADCKEHYFQKTVDLTKEYTLISLETRVDLDERYRRPDVLLESLDGKQLWVEFWVSHETEEDKRKDGRIIEIKIETEKDLEKIRQHKIVQSEGEDLAVRVFSIDTNCADDLFLEDDLPINSYPCERFFCFEANTNGFSAEIIDYIKTKVTYDLSYRAILRLNWNGRHDSNIGIKGNQITQEDLRDFFIKRYYSIVYGSRQVEKTYDSLVVSEWKSEDIKEKTITRSAYRSSYKPSHQVPTLPVVSVADLSAIEWVDLDLPSKTLWAKNDVTGQMSFGAARKAYGAHVPSKSDVEELKMCCSVEWDNTSRSFVVIGRNGNTISFPCKDDHKSYWLNAYEGGPTYGQCFHIGPNYRFWINDKDTLSALFVRLVNH